MVAAKPMIALMLIVIGSAIRVARITSRRASTIMFLDQMFTLLVYSYLVLKTT